MLSHLLNDFADEIPTDMHPGEAAFILWRGEQMAIGELMTEKDGDELYCMGYATFVEKYKNHDSFRRWFRPVEQGYSDLVMVHEKHDSVATYRLRRAQHRLVDLINLLDPLDSFAKHVYKVDAALNCCCYECPGRPGASSESV